ncbi:MAG: TetR/AcrR family transcriptional regulator [Bdellovibrionales bacterium]|nr:TetR/AcrR family transcriptional regulator [Bdellovibrionales bacterium]
MANVEDSRFFRLFEVQPRKGDLRKLEIVLGAVRLIATRGADQVTLDSVGKGLGVRRSHVAYYFATREELIESVIQLIIATGQDILIETVKTARTPREGIEKHVEGHCEWLRKYPEHAAVMLMFYYQCTYDKKMRALNTEIRSKGQDRIVGMLDQFPKFKKLKRLQKIKLAADYQNILTGHLIAHFSSAGSKDLRAVRESILNCLWALLTPYLP